MADNITNLTDANFEQEVIQSETPVLVDFWAPWCGPCRQLMPLIEEIAGEYNGAVKIGKLNIDESPNTASKYQVHSIPTIIIFKGGDIQNTLVGMQPKSRYVEAVESAKG